jgi:HD-GYP domain-containing protein (c-di-GMP phosphodiesterase class II)
VSVCDAYDAMITTRAYRTARARPEAVAELRCHSGTQFDPEVVEAFVSSLEAFGDEQVESLVRRDARLGAVAVQAIQTHDRQGLLTT